MARKIKVENTKMPRAGAVEMTDSNRSMASQPLTEKEIKSRLANRKFAATTTFGSGLRKASNGDVMDSSFGNFYSPQLSTDFLEKPQNLRERRAFYRHFYNSNEFVGQAVDLHSTLPLSKLRLDKPHAENQDLADYVYDFYTDMCSDMKLFKTLIEISHEYVLFGNCVVFGSKVRTPDGFKNVEDVKVGDLLLTHKGRFRKVVKTHSREAKSVLNIKTWNTFEELRLTEEHPVEVLRENGKFEFINAEDVTEADYIRVTWPTGTIDVKKMSFTEFDNITKTVDGYERHISAIKPKNGTGLNFYKEKLVNFLGSITEPVVVTRQDLSNQLGISRKKLDETVSSLKRDVGNSFTKRLGPTKYQGGSQVSWLPAKFNPEEVNLTDHYDVSRVYKYLSPHEIEIDSDFCYLLGYWLGDGTLARDRSREGIWGRGIWNICFGDHSIAQKEKIKKILQEKVGEGCLRDTCTEREYLGKKSKLHTIVVKNPAFMEWWSLNFGETSIGGELGKSKKNIPLWITNLPCEKLIHLLAGTIDSDGCAGEYKFILSLTSRTVSEKIREISLKCGIPCYWNKTVTRVSALCQNRKQKNLYTLTFNRGSSFNSLNQVCTKKVCKKLPSSHINKDYDDNVSKRSSKFKQIGNSLALKVRSIQEEDYSDFVYNFEVEEDHTFQVNGYSTHNCFIFANENDPYENKEEGEIAKIKELGKHKSQTLFEKFKITDKDPNYKGWKKLIVLPPDQVRVQKLPLSDETKIEFIPDPETRKTIMAVGTTSPFHEEDEDKPILPDKLIKAVQEGGSIPLDSDPASGSHVFHLARKKSQYETMGVSIIERCINTLVLNDKLRQAQTSIASRHMTPIRIVWAEELSDMDVSNLRDQVDMALMDPDFSIVANYRVNWEEMGVSGRLLELSTEYEHQENSLFAGLGVTREILTGEGTYTGNRVTLEIMNTQYLLFRELIQDYVENNIFKPVARKKGFIEIDKFGREKLIYPKLSFTRLAIRDNDSFFDQTFQLYNKGSVSIDVILDMLNIDPVSTKKKVEADLFTVNDSAFNDLIRNMYTALGQEMATKTDVVPKLAKYLNLAVVEAPAEDAGGGGDSNSRFAKAKDSINEGLKKANGKPGMTEERKAAFLKVMETLSNNPEALDKIEKSLKG